MAVTIRIVEDVPEVLPELPSPSPLSVAASELDQAALWERIEQHVAYRWSPRGVTFIVEGPGEWVAPLVPVDIETIELWNGTWGEVELEPSPLGGFMLPCPGPYRFTGVVGEDAEPPAAAIEAFRRFAEYCAQRPGKSGARVETVGAGTVNMSVHRHEAWMARALQNSGAADLLRTYRRAA